MLKAIQQGALSERVNAPRHAFKLAISRPKLGIILQILGACLISTSWMHPLFWDHSKVGDGVIISIMLLILSVGLWVWNEGEKRRD